MPANLKVIHESYRKEWLDANAGRRARAFNRMLKEALLKGGEHWLDVLLPLHFDMRAYGRYGYASRGRGYEQIKQTRRFITSHQPIGSAVAGELTGTKGRFGRFVVPNPNYGQPPRPFMYTNTLRDEVMTAAAGGQLMAAAVRTTTSRADSAQLRIPIKLPHPINPKNAGELVRLIPGEATMLTRVIAGRLRQLMADAGVSAERMEIGG